MSTLAKWLIYHASVVVAACALTGCAGPTDRGAGEDATSQLAQSARITVAPPVSDVTRDYLALFSAAFERANATHPDIQALTATTLPTFAGGEGRLATALGTFLRERPSHEVSVREALAEFSAFATAKIAEAAGPDGAIGDSLAENLAGLSSWFSKSRDALERQMLHSVLQSSPGIRIDPMLDTWTRLEPEIDGSFSAFHVSGTPPIDAVARLLGLDEIMTTKTGTAAVDQFVDFLRDGDFDLEALPQMWTSESVRAQYLIDFGNEVEGGLVLAIVDEHDQLFAYELLIRL